MDESEANGVAEALLKFVTPGMEELRLVTRRQEGELKMSSFEGNPRRKPKGTSFDEKCPV